MQEQYAELLVKFEGGEIGETFTHLPPLFANDGGHGMLFQGEQKLYLTFHSPNAKGLEHPAFFEVLDDGASISMK